MEDNSNAEVTTVIQPTISKTNRDFLKKISKSPNFNLAEKMDILTSGLSVTVEEVEDMLSQLDLSLIETEFSAAKLHTLKESKRYLISSAQNGSPVNVDFLHNMEAYAKFINAQIGIIATRYKNPTSRFRDEDVWAAEVQPYLTANRQFLHKDLLLLADLKVQATSPNPTNGIELFGDNASVIVGAPRIEMRVVPILPTQTQKFLYSTGTTTVPNFTDSVAGGKAGAHHSYGFVIVEIESDEIVHIRSVSASEDGSFNDLIYRVENAEVTSETIDTFVWGDSHFAQKEQRVTDAFRKLCSDLQIQTSVLHDVWDSQSLNIHNEKDPITQHKLMAEGKDDLRKELSQMYEELDWFEQNMNHTLVISSNHDDMLDRAMKYSDWKHNMKNAIIFLEMLQLTLSGKAKDGIIPYYINNKYKNIEALGLNDSYVKYGIELAIHGHKGPNGSRGSAQSFSRLSQKTIVGHSHSPSIRWGCYQVGISCGMDHGYNHGLSGWAYAGVTLNKHGKRQMIVFNKETLTYTTLY
jgi:hypothetical protein